MSRDEGVTSGAWKIEPGRAVCSEGVDDTVVISHDRCGLLYVDHGDLADLIGALMFYLDVEKVEAG